jgi:hypothetical protein
LLYDTSQPFEIQEDFRSVADTIWVAVVVAKADAAKYEIDNLYDGFGFITPYPRGEEG